MPDHRTHAEAWTARTRRRTLPALALVALLAGTSGCSGERGGTSVHALTRDVSGCAAALPVARATVPARSTLVQVHSVSAATALRVLRTTSSEVPRRALHGVLCVIAYRGPYQVGEVARAPSEHGRFAVLLLTVRHPEVLALVLRDQLPHEV